MERRPGGREPERVLLDAMDWKQRFTAAWVALCKMECRAEDAERKLKYFEMLTPVPHGERK